MKRGILYILHHVARYVDLMVYCMLGGIPIMMTHTIQTQQVGMISWVWFQMFMVWATLLTYMYLRLHYTSRKFTYGYDYYNS